MWQMTRDRCVYVDCAVTNVSGVVQIEDDLLHPNPANEKRKHKLKRLVQAPNSFFMDVKCPGCFNMLVPFPFSSSCSLRCWVLLPRGYIFLCCIELMGVCLFIESGGLCVGSVVSDVAFFSLQHHRLQPCAVGCALRKL